jgi:hypothetical protein
MTRRHDAVVDELALVGTAEVAIEALAARAWDLSSGIIPRATLAAWLAPTA